ncbi:MAG: CRISPR-associated endonuclease Cas1 [Deltaproteobacteria bacterium]|nr:CRISPR-associated endonuclease Cas1 [Deltaproteobacteria bacterium]
MTAAPTSLFTEICSTTVLLDAWRRIQKKGARGGLDGVSVQSFSDQAATHLEDLRQALLAGNYAPEPHQRIKVPKLDGSGELRPLSLPTIKDKIIQEAVRRLIEPIFESEFLPCSYAYRPGQGPRRAIGKAIHYLDHEKCRWAVHADFDKFFDTLDQEILLRRLQEKISEPPVLKLVRMWLRIGSIGSRGTYDDTEMGVSQGGIMSPLLSNIYVHPLDVYLIDKGHRYIRYADNVLILADSQPRGAEGLNDLTYFSQEMLKLRLNPEAKPLRHVADGFTFLGIHFKGRQRRLSDAKMAKIRRKIDWLTNRRQRRDLAKSVADLQEALEGIRRYYTVVNPQAQFQQLEDYLKSRLSHLVAEHFRRGTCKKLSDAATPLSALTWLSRPDPQAQAQKAQEVARLGREMGQKSKAPADGPAVTPPAPKPPPQQGDKARESTTRSVSGLTPMSVPPTDPVAAAAPDRDLTEGTGRAAATEATIPRSEGKGDQTAQSVPAAAGAAPTPSGAPETPATPPWDEAPQAALARADQAVARKKRKYIKKLAVETEVAVTSPGSFVGKQGGRLFIRRDRKQVYSIPLIRVRGLNVHSSGVTLSSDLIKALSDKKMSIHFCTPGGEPYAILHAPISPQAELSRFQLTASQNQTGLLLAREFVEGKIRNQLNLLKYYLRSRQAETDDRYAALFPEKSALLQRSLKKLAEIPLGEDYDAVRDHLFALEGQAGAAYWAMIKTLLAPEIDYPGRERRGATDLVNSLLNYGYGMLYPRIWQALLLAGLNPHISFLHSFQDNKPTLAFDLIEEFRPQVVDRAIFSMLTRGEKLTQEKSGVLLTLESRRKVITQVIERLGTLNPYRGQKVSLEEIIRRQARLLAGHLQGKKRYRPFLGRY